MRQCFHACMATCSTPAEPKLDAKLQDYATLAVRDSVDKKVRSCTGSCELPARGCGFVQLRRFRRAFSVDSKLYVLTDAAADDEQDQLVADCATLADAVQVGGKLYERKTKVPSSTFCDIHRF